MNAETPAKKFSPAKLKEARHERGWSRKRLGEIAHRAPMSIYQWETGKAEPNANSLGALSAALHMPIGALYE